jgi:hypothetical protein
VRWLKNKQRIFKVALGTYQPKTQGNFLRSTPFSIKDNLGSPLIVVVREHIEEFKGNGLYPVHPVLFVALVDLGPVLKGGEAQVYGNALIGSGVIVDRLKEYAGTGTKLPVKFSRQAPANGGNSYFVVDPLDGAEMALAVKWDEKYPNRIEEELAALQAEADAKAAEEGNGSAPSFTGLGNQTPAPAVVSNPAVDNDALQKAMDALNNI